MIKTSLDKRKSGSSYYWKLPKEIYDILDLDKFDQLDIFIVEKRKTLKEFIENDNKRSS